MEEVKKHSWVYKCYPTWSGTVCYNCECIKYINGLPSEKSRLPCPGKIRHENPLTPDRLEEGDRNEGIVENNSKV